MLFRRAISSTITGNAQETGAAIEKKNVNTVTGICSF